MKPLRLKTVKRRRLRQPSGRNLQVYHEVRELGVAQAEAAARHGVTQERVSQICRQVERWLARSQQPHGSDDLGRAELHLERRRCQALYAAAFHELAKGDQSLLTQRVQTRGHEKRTVETTRQQPLNPQWAKLVAALSQRLAKLDAALGPDEEETLMPHWTPQALSELKSSSSSKVSPALAGALAGSRDDATDVSAVY